MFVSSLRELPENCVYKQSGLNLKLLTANFLSYDIESAKKKSAFLNLHIKTINFLFYNFVLILAKND
jgi:hypothetical protein